MSNDDKNTSDFRRLLQEKLANSEAAQDGWNVPSGGVWAGISEELKATQPLMRDTRKPIWPWLTIGILAAMLIFRECSHHRAIGQMQQEMHQLQQDCEEKLSKRRNTSPENNSETTTLAMGAAPVAFHDEAKAEVSKSEPLNRSIKTSKQPSKNRTTGDKTKLISTTTHISTEVPLAIGQSTTEYIPVNAQHVNTTALPILPSQGLRFFHKNSQLPTTTLNLQITPKKQRIFSLNTGAFAGLSLTGNRLTGDKPSIISKQKAMLAWQSGVGLEAVINRHWSVLTGLSYNTSRIETDYNLAVPFTHNGEFQHDDGNFDNKYNHSLPSALGNYPLQMVLTRASDATIHEGEVMNLELRIHQKTQFLSLPLQLRYGFGKNRWQMGVRAGAVANHVLAVESESPDLKSLHAAIHQRHMSIGTPQLADLEKWTIDYLVGLDCRYQLTPRFGLNAQTSWQKAVSPIYQDDAVENYLQALNLGLGVHYLLR